MFITGRRSCTRTGEQRAAGQFLMVWSRPGSRELRCLVRSTKLQQCGQFMGGEVIIRHPAALAANETISPWDRERYPNWWRVRDGQYRVGLSGTYGSDGLPLDADQWPGLWDLLHPLPAELVEAFWSGGGHNSAGAEGPAIHEWATTNLSTLRRVRDPRLQSKTESCSSGPP